MSLPSPSSHHRVANCLPSELLPHSRTTTAGATAGTELHAFLERVPSLGLDRALEMAPEHHREAFRAIDFNRLPMLHGGWRPEVAFAYDLETASARELPPLAGHREYVDLKPTEFPGTIDTHCIDGETAYVYDYKSAFAPADAPPDNHQLRSYALLVCRATGARQAKFGLIRIGTDGTPWFETAFFDGDELDAYELELFEVLESLTALRRARDAGELQQLVLQQTHEGPWCRYCPAFSYCPSKTNQLRTLAYPEAGLEEALRAELTGERQAAVYERLKAAGAMVDRLLEVARELARREPIALPTGLVLGAVKTERDELLAEPTYAHVRTNFGEEVAEIAAPQVGRETSKKALEKAMQRVIDLGLVPGAKRTPLLDAQVEALREKGAVKTKTSVTVREVKPSVFEKTRAYPPNPPPALPEGETPATTEVA